MIEYVKDVKTGETSSWLSEDFAMKKWLLDHPPYIYWNVIQDTKNKRLLVFDGPVLNEGNDKLCYEIHCNNMKEVYGRLTIMEHHLREDMRYALITRRPGLGISGDTVQYLCDRYKFNNYGSRSDCFSWIFKGYPEGGYGYGVHSEIRLNEIRYPDGSEWDTYQNEYRYTKDDPNHRERVTWARRIDVSVDMTMDTRDTPTKIIDRAVKFVENPELIRLLQEVFRE